MRIQINKSDASIEIEGDEAKFAEMVSIHGPNNVINLDAEPVVDAPVVDAPVEPVEPVVDAPVESPVEETPGGPDSSQDPANPEVV